MKSLRFVPCIAALLLVVATGLAQPAGSPGTASIRGILAGTVTVTPVSLADLVFEVQYHGKGRALGIGQVSAEFLTPEVKLDLAQRQLIPLTPTWTLTVAAHNGDEIHADYTFPDGAIEYSVLGFFVATADIEVTGGTGMYDGASGAGHAVIVGNVFLRRWVSSIEGDLVTTAPRR